MITGFILGESGVYTPLAVRSSSAIRPVLECHPSGPRPAVVRFSSKALPSITNYKLPKPPPYLIFHPTAQRPGELVRLAVEDMSIELVPMRIVSIFAVQDAVKD